MKTLPANMVNKITHTPCPVPGLEGDCWTWTGARTGNGYGSVGYQGRTWSSHKLAYTLLVGPVPDGLTLDHLCFVQVCANPAHMEPVTNAENVRRAHLKRCPQAPPPTPEQRAAMLASLEDILAWLDAWLALNPEATEVAS